MNTLKNEILAFVDADLQGVEKALEENLCSQHDLVSQVAGHILFAGGKRLRPLLVVLGARLCGLSGAPVYPLAVSFEYIHAASLLHDDIMDGGRTRRGKPAAHLLHGLTPAILVGDFLFSRACGLAAATKNIAVIQLISDIPAAMSEGEIFVTSATCARDRPRSSRCCNRYRPKSESRLTV